MTQLPKGLSYVNGRLTFSNENISEIAELYGTPTYIYSEPVSYDLAMFGII